MRGRQSGCNENIIQKSEHKRTYLFKESQNKKKKIHILMILRNIGVIKETERFWKKQGNNQNTKPNFYDNAEL